MALSREIPGHNSLIFLILLTNFGCAMAPAGKPPSQLDTQVAQNTGQTPLVERLSSLAKSGRQEQALRDGIVAWQSNPSPQDAVALAHFFAQTYADLGQPLIAFDWYAAAAGKAQLAGPSQQRQVQASFESFVSRQNPTALKTMLQKCRDPQLAALIRSRTVSTQPTATAPAVNGPAARYERIGALIPFNGKYAQFGSEILEGLKKAKEDWIRTNPGDEVELIVKDTGADPATDAKGFAELVQNDGVMAVIGPLNKDSVAQVATSANQWGVPLLAMASREDASTNDGAYVTRFLPDDIEMCETLVRQSMAKGLTKFADLHPQDRYGEKLSNAFRQAVADNGGQLVISVPYKAGKTDFQATVSRLAGKRPVAANEKAPFDALFIPDKFETVQLIAPYLPYCNLTGVTLIGPAIWDSPALSTATDIHTAGAMFVTTTQKRQGSFLGMQAYDALKMILEARRSVNQGTPQRQALIRGLQTIHGFQGIGGRLSWENGYVGRESVVRIIGQAQ